MFASALAALKIVFDPAFRGVLLKSALLTLFFFAALFAGVETAIAHLPTLGWHWVNVLLEWLLPVLFVLLLAVLGAPVAALMGTFFLDEIASAVERKSYPPGLHGHNIPFFEGLWAGLRLTFWIFLVSLLLLPLHIVLPVMGTAIALMVDGWLLGREYFELSALRHMAVGDADAMRRRRRPQVFGAGLLISVVAAIPLVNLISPLFASAFMAHEFIRCQRLEHPA